MKILINKKNQAPPTSLSQSENNFGSPAQFINNFNTNVMFFKKKRGAYEIFF